MKTKFEHLFGGMSREKKNDLKEEKKWNYKKNIILI